MAVRLVGLFYLRKLTGCYRSNEYFDLQGTDLLQEKIYVHGPCIKMYTVVSCVLTDFSFVQGRKGLIHLAMLHSGNCTDLHCV